MEYDTNDDVHSVDSINTTNSGYYGPEVDPNLAACKDILDGHNIDDDASTTGCDYTTLEGVSNTNDRTWEEDIEGVGDTIPED